MLIPLSKEIFHVDSHVKVRFHVNSPVKVKFHVERMGNCVPSQQHGRVSGKENKETALGPIFLARLPAFFSPQSICRFLFWGGGGGNSGLAMSASPL